MRIVILIIFSLLFYMHCTTSKDTRKIKTREKCDFKVFTYLGAMPEKSKLFLQENKIDKFYMVGEANIDPRKEFKVDEAHLRNYIRKYIPDENASGYCSFDWETPLNVLKLVPVDSLKFKLVEREFIKAYEIAKEERPNLKWGYYALPFRCYWKRNQTWKNQNKKLINIMSATDVLFPSVYDFYQEKNPYAGKKMDSLYVNDNIEQALNYGNKLDKPVVAFFWHRWHGKQKHGGFKRIPWEEFGPHIQAALDVSVDNKRLDGLIWWGADHYFHSVKTKPLLDESSSYSDFDEYNNKVIIETTTNILNLVNDYCLNKN